MLWRTHHTHAHREHTRTFIADPSALALGALPNRRLPRVLRHLRLGLGDHLLDAVGVRTATGQQLRTFAQLLHTHTNTDTYRNTHQSHSHLQCRQEFIMPMNELYLGEVYSVFAIYG
jgi:hypothetical protein